MQRFHLRKKHVFKRKLKPAEKIVIVITAIILALIISFRYASSRITPVLMNYAEVEARKFINAIINKAVSETKIEDINDLFIISKTEDEINTIDFNVNIVNNMLTSISTKIQESIRLMDSGQLSDIPGYDNEKLKKGIIYELPSGLVFSNNLLSNIGPKIPVKISMRGSIISNVDTSLSNYGINNALVKVSINLKLDEQVLLPFTLKKIQIETNIPVIIKLIEGSVPKYYAGGINQSSPILSIPLEES